MTPPPSVSWFSSTPAGIGLNGMSLEIRLTISLKVEFHIRKFVKILTKITLFLVLIPLKYQTLVILKMHLKLSVNSF